MVASSVRISASDTQELEPYGPLISMCWLHDPDGRPTADKVRFELRCVLHMPPLLSTSMQALN